MIIVRTKHSGGGSTSGFSQAGLSIEASKVLEGYITSLVCGSMEQCWGQ